MRTLRFGIAAVIALAGVFATSARAEPDVRSPACVKPLVFIVFFDWNTWELSSVSSRTRAGIQAVIAEAVMAVKSGHIAVVLVAGHNDSIGSHEYNRQLNYRRALTVRAEMLRLGLGEHRIVMAGETRCTHETCCILEPWRPRAIIELGK